jgi:tetratricopeptide (TPR) repeat protein
LEVAKAYRLVAIQDFAMGDGSRARHDIEAAILLSERLSKDRPYEWAIASEAATEHQWSTVIGYNGVADEEERIAEDRRRAVQVDEALLRLRPNDADTLHRYALNLGYLAAQLGRSDPKLALTYGQKVLQIEIKLQQESPKTRLAGGLAFAYSVLVDLFLKDIHDYASARSYAERQLLGGQQAVRLDPRNHMLQRILAAQYLYLAEVDSKTGRLSQSLEGLKKGQAIARALIEADPENIPNRGVLADNLSFTGQVLLLARKPKDAFGQLDEARALYEPFPKTDSKATGSPIKAAICLVKMGEAAGQMGKPVLAETYFRRSLISVEPHVAQSTDREALFTAAAAYAGLANLEARRAQGLMASQESRRDSWVAAEVWYRKSLGAWKRIDFPNRETPLDLDFGEPTTVAKNLERCESTLSSIR